MPESDTIVQDTGVQIRRDGKIVASFYNDSAENAAFEWLLKHQGHSVFYAIKWGGYQVVVIHPDGTEEPWQYKIA